MRYTLVWQPLAEARLAEIWVTVADRHAVSFMRADAICEIAVVAVKAAQNEGFRNGKPHTKSAPGPG
jgi:hypothetical protein